MALMLEYAMVMDKGGLVLWEKNFFNPLRGNPVDRLIQLVLLEERSALGAFDHETYSLKWRLVNELSLVFVVVWQKTLPLAASVDSLLDDMKSIFINKYSDVVKDKSRLVQIDFNEHFDKLLKLHARKEAVEKVQGQKQRSFTETKKYKEMQQNKLQKLETKSEEESSTSSEKLVPDDDSALSQDDLRKRNEEKLRALGRIKKTNSRTSSSDLDPSKKTAPPKKLMAASKKTSLSASEIKALDRTDGQTAENADVQGHLIDEKAMEAFRSRQKEGQESFEVEDISYPDPEDDLEDDLELDTSKRKESTGVFGFLKNLTGQKELQREDLEPVIENMKSHFVSKNVAVDIADKLCESVLQTLIGQKTGSFSGVASVVRQGMEAALNRILTPTTSTDLLRDIRAAKREGRPYTMVFCGVNGVGKSTNLAKVCFWLLQNNQRVLIAACDTFRSGAVQQLQVHVRNLKALDVTGNAQTNVDVYQRGYDQDAANIAKEAIAYAKANKIDVVLIDTAGRMQHNEKLMRALAKLVKVNVPDKVLFVGEALVGNDGVDQLQKFNQSLLDFADSTNPRQIDGILLTKFDTIDDKVGAALSMTYLSGQPIFFLGVGQTYTDLRKLNVKSIVSALLN
eukprot:Lithocolla_globosa_v1_NODE_1007_length_2960_cov_19.123924.p1 type:complete len:625 gc:universal NODE_1007_length_2960_cov_19.123924:398-2272(+)